MSKSNLQLALEIALQTKNIDDVNVLVAELKKAGHNVEHLEKSSKALSHAWEDLNPKEQAQRLRRLKEACVSTASGQKVLADSIANTTKAAKKADKEIEELSDEAKHLEEIAKAKITLGIDTDDKAKKQIQEATKAYETLKNSGKLSNTELARASELHTQKVAKLEKQLGKTAPEASNLTAEMGKLATASAGLAYISKAAISFEQAMAGVKKTVDGTPEEIQALSSEIKQLSVDLGLSSEAVADIAAQGGQLGVPVEQLGKFTEMAGKMAVAFDMTAEQAADATAKLANVFSIPIIEVEALGDAINTLGNNTAAKEREIVAAMLRIGGSAKQFGLAEEQAASLAAAMIALGKPPEVAATAINALLNKLQTAQTQGKKFQGALASIGTSADEMAQNIQANPQQALNDFLAKLGELDKQQRAIATAELFGQEYSDDISLLVGSLGTYNHALGLTADKSATAGAMNKEFEAQMAATGKQIDQAKEAVNNLSISLGTELLPIISSVVGGFTDVVGAVDGFTQSYPNITKFVVLIGGGTLALKALQSAFKITGALGVKSALDIAKSYTTAGTAIAGTSKQTKNLGNVLGDVIRIAGSLATAFSAGFAFGDVLYENIGFVKTLGDNLARIPAMIHSMVTTGNLEQYRENFKTTAEATKRLGDEAEATAEKTKTLAEKQQQAAAQAENQAIANRNLVNKIILTRAELEQMSTALAKMEADGEKGSAGYKTLSSQLKQTQIDLNDLTSKAEASGLGEKLKTDLEKASGAFQALGLDAKEFATGISNETNAALSAYVQVSKLAGDNTQQLARAYAAAKEKVGENAQAQALLEQKLKQVTQGNTELATAVKATAQAQSDAKNASDEQSKALDKLGISMDAVNAKMSKSGLDMVQNLKTGITAIKEQATSAEALKTALTQALDVSIQSAKTKADFEAINQTLKHTGVTAKVSSEQLALINQGMAGGAEGIKKHAAAMADYTKSVDDNTTSTTQNTASAAENAKAREQQTAASAKATQAVKEQTDAMQRATVTTVDMSNSMVGWSNQQIHGLQELGLSAQQTQTIMENLFTSIVGNRYASDKAYNAAIQGLTDNAVRQAQAFARLKNEAASMTQTLGSATVSSNDLSHAQGILNRATTATVNGLIRMDNQTLDNLRNAISSARQRMQGLAKDAKNTADSLAANLARMKGDDNAARAIEQRKKLLDIEAKIQEARRRGNAKEVAELERALSLQKKINAEEDKQARQRKADTVKSKQQKAYSHTKQTNHNNSNTGSTLTANQVANAWEQKIAMAREAAKREAKEEFMKELRDEAKRRAR